MKNEEWRTVVIDGEIYEGYEVSNMGRVRSLNYGGRTCKVQVLKPNVNTRGYLQVCLYKNGERKWIRVHRLVAFAFIPIPNDDIENKTDVNHIDENKQNNRADNLEWTTRKQNLNHGTHNERSAKARSKKICCVETGEVFESTIEVERKLGLNHGHISRCCNGEKNYKSCGKHPITGERLHWMYYSDYLEKQNKENSDTSNN